MNKLTLTMGSTFVILAVLAKNKLAVPHQRDVPSILHEVSSSMIWRGTILTFFTLVKRVSGVIAPTATGTLLSNTASSTAMTSSSRSGTTTAQPSSLSTKSETEFTMAQAVNDTRTFALFFGLAFETVDAAGGLSGEPSFCRRDGHAGGRLLHCQRLSLGDARDVLLELYMFRKDPDIAAKGGCGESSWTTARCKRHVAPVSEKPGCSISRRTEAGV